MKTGNRLHAGGFARSIALAIAHVAIGARERRRAPRARAGAGAARSPAGPKLTEQQRLRAQSPGGPLTTGVELPRWPEQPDALAGATIVTDEMLRIRRRTTG